MAFSNTAISQNIAPDQYDLIFPYVLINTLNLPPILIKLMLEYCDTCNNITTYLFDSIKANYAFLILPAILLGANPNVQTKSHLAPLCEAIIYNHPLVIKALLEVKALVNPLQGPGTIPLQHTIEDEKKLFTIQALLKFNADLEWKPGLNCATILHRASKEMKSSFLLSPLIESQALLDTMDKTHNAPLHYAVWGEHVDTIKTLLEVKADINLQDKEGCTAWEGAQKTKQTHIITLFPEMKKATSPAVQIKINCCSIQ